MYVSKRSRLNVVTISGNVRFIAISSGTPSSSRSMFASGVITERAEKSTRLPIKLPRTRPVLAPRRDFSVFRGRPERWAAGGRPLMSLSTYVATSYCSSLVHSSMISALSPLSILSRRRWLMRTMLISLCVRSSSIR